MPDTIRPEVPPAPEVPQAPPVPKRPKIIREEAGGSLLEKSSETILLEAEQAKITKYETNKKTGESGKDESLRDRYNDEKVKPEYVLNQIRKFSEEHGAEYQSLNETEENKDFTNDTKELVLNKVYEQIKKLLESEGEGRGRYSIEKSKSVKYVVDEYAKNLISSGKKLNCKVVFEKLQEIVAVLAFQDLKASENLLGDHGIRHLVDHNIKVSMQMLDQVEGHNVGITSTHRLMMLETMIYHDLGYAMDPVVELVHKREYKGDVGHDVLAAKFVRERKNINGDVNREIFSEEELSLIHEGVLNHSADIVSIDFPKDSDDEREKTRKIREIFTSIIHIADNTHAFETKLPELLYSVPETIEYMQALRAASMLEDGNERNEIVEEIKELLLREIDKSNNSFTAADKKALRMAVEKHLNGDSFKFNVPRICGNNPEISIDSAGKVLISVEESEVHRSTVQIFDVKEIQQLKKFISDLGGKLEDDQDFVDIQGKLKIEIRKPQSSNNDTEFQRRVSELLERKSLEELTLIGGKSIIKRAEDETKFLEQAKREGDTVKMQEHQQILEALREQLKESLSSFIVTKEGELS